jgi:hypothetical protein
MITIKFSVPEVVVPPISPRVYLWFAYFWADIHALSNAPPEFAVYVPALDDSRGIFNPQIPYADTMQYVPIPEFVGTFQTSLDDGGQGIAGIGVIAVLFQESDTPDDAISAGYAAFGPAVLNQLNQYVAAHGLVKPTADQVRAIANGINSDVTNAVQSKLSIWDFGKGQDAFVGFSHLLLAGSDDLKPGQSFPLPPINEPDTSAGSNFATAAEYFEKLCTGPIDGPRSVDGDFPYPFPCANAVVEVPSGPDPCAAQAGAVQKAAAVIQDLNTQLQGLRQQQETANHLQRQVLQVEIDKITKTQLPAAKAAYAKALKQLALCRATRGTTSGGFEPAA